MSPWATVNCMCLQVQMSARSPGFATTMKVPSSPFVGGDMTPAVCVKNIM